MGWSLGGRKRSNPQLLEGSNPLVGFEAADLNGDGLTGLVGSDKLVRSRLLLLSHPVPGPEEDCDHDFEPDACAFAADPDADRDGNGVFDACEMIAPRFRRADPNSDGASDTSD